MSVESLGSGAVDPTRLGDSQVPIAAPASAPEEVSVGPDGRDIGAPVRPRTGGDATLLRAAFEARLRASGFDLEDDSEDVATGPDDVRAEGEPSAAQSDLEAVDGYREWATNLGTGVPSAMYEQMQGRLDGLIESGRTAEAAAFMAETGGVAGFLHRHPGLHTALSGLETGAAAVELYMSYRALDLAVEEGRTADAASAMLSMGVNGFALLPEGLRSRIEQRMGVRVPELAAFARNVATLAAEVAKPFQDPPQSVDADTLWSESVAMVANLIQAIPDEQRAHLVARLGAVLGGPIAAVAGPYGDRLVTLVQNVPLILRTIDEWDQGSSRAANVTALARALGPEVIGTLVQIGTGSQTAGDIAKFLAEQAVGPLADLGDGARESAEGMARQLDQFYASEAAYREMLEGAASAYGLSRGNQRQLVDLASGRCGPELREIVLRELQSGDPERLQTILSAFASANRMAVDNGGGIQSQRAIVEQMSPVRTERSTFGYAVESVADRLLGSNRLAAEQAVRDRYPIWRSSATDGAAAAQFLLRRAAPEGLEREVFEAISADQREIIALLS